jgi:hypothetical protein
MQSRRSGRAAAIDNQKPVQQSAAAKAANNQLRQKVPASEGDPGDQTLAILGLTRDAIQPPKVRIRHRTRQKDPVETNQAPEEKNVRALAPAKPAAVAPDEARLANRQEARLRVRTQLIGALLSIQEIRVDNDRGHTIVRGILARFDDFHPADAVEDSLASRVTIAEELNNFFARKVLKASNEKERSAHMRHFMQSANTLSKLLEQLDRRRGKGHQKMTIERVNVASGGQAMVGMITSGDRRNDSSAPSTSEATSGVPKLIGNAAPTEE